MGHRGLSVLQLPPHPDLVPFARDCVCGAARLAGLDEEVIRTIASHVMEVMVDHTAYAASDRPSLAIVFGLNGQQSFGVAVGEPDGIYGHELTRFASSPATVAEEEPAREGLRAAPECPLDGTGMAVSLRLPTGKAGVPQARRFVTAALYATGREEAASVAELLSSELVTNAGQHTDGGIQIALVLETRGTRIEVSDTSVEPPTLLDASALNGKGHGLTLVEQLASRWGYVLLPGGKAVWLELDHADADRGRTGTSEPAPVDRR